MDEHIYHGPHKSTQTNTPKTNQRQQKTPKKLQNQNLYHIKWMTHIQTPSQFTHTTPPPPLLPSLSGTIPHS